MTNNVLPFPSRDPSNRPSSRAARANALEGQARLDPKLRAQLAANLGKLAKRLNPDDPAQGAYDMFEGAFGAELESQWRKRKRLVRLPDEEAPIFKIHGDYEAGGAKYVRLANAWAQLAESSADRALNDLLRGTPLGASAAGTPAPEEVVALLAEATRPILTRLAAMQEVALAFEYLRQYPLCPWSAEDLSEEPTVDNCQSPRWNDHFNLLPISTCTIKDDWVEADGAQEDHWLPWYLPRVKIGYAYSPAEVDFYELGVAAEFDARASERFPDVDIGHARAFLTEDEIDDGRLNKSILVYPHSRVAVYLVLVSAIDGPRLAFATAGHEVRAPGDRFSYSENFPDAIVEIQASPQDDVLHKSMEDGRGFFGLIELNDHVFAYNFEQWADRYESLPCGCWGFDSDQSAEVLSFGETEDPFFKPIVWDDQRHFAGAPQVSVAATILRNAYFAPAGQGIGDLLADDARSRLGPVVEFMTAEQRKLELAREAWLAVTHPS